MKNVKEIWRYITSGIDGNASDNDLKQWAQSLTDAAFEDDMNLDSGNEWESNFYLSEVGKLENHYQVIKDNGSNKYANTQLYERWHSFSYYCRVYYKDITQAYNVWQFIENRINGDSGITEQMLKHWAQRLSEAIFLDDETAPEDNMSDYLSSIYEQENRCYILLKHSKKDSATNQKRLETWRLFRSLYLANFEGIAPTRLSLVALRYLDSIQDGLSDPEPVEQPQQEKNSETDLTDSEKRIFDEAIKANFMEKTDSGYRWLYHRHKDGKPHKASFAYFLNSMYYKLVDDDNRDYNDVCLYGTKYDDLFGIKDLDSAQTALKNAKKKKQHWTFKIDEFFANLETRAFDEAL